VPTPPPSAIVLLSGGLDSAVTLALAQSKGFRCHTLSFDYGQRHRAELRAATRLAHARHVLSHRVVRIDLRAVGGSALTANIPVPHAAPASRNLRAHTAIPVTYVPARNLVFLSLAAGLAEVVGADSIHIGVNAIDYSGYPDCRPAFIRAFERCVAKGTRAGSEGHPVRVHAPLIRMTKAEIIRTAARLGLDLGLTHSCYNPSRAGLACGQCDSCAIRARGFADANVPDPTRYAARLKPAPRPPAAPRSTRPARRPTAGQSRTAR
jgi:7-cyano-7-deazaguanine synthase